MSSVEELTKQLEDEKKQLKKETKQLKKLKKKTEKLAEENNKLKSEYDSLTSPSVSRVAMRSDRNVAVDNPEEARLMRAMSPRGPGGISRVKSAGHASSSKIIVPKPKVEPPVGDWSYQLEIRVSSGAGTKFLKVRGSTVKGENQATKDISLADPVYLETSWADVKGRLGADFPSLAPIAIMEHPSGDRRNIDDQTRISTLGFELVDFRNNLFKFYTNALGDIPVVAQQNNNDNLPKWKRDQLEAERIKQARLQKEEEIKMKKVASIKHIQQSKGMDVEATADDGIPRTFSSSSGHTFTENLANHYVSGPQQTNNGHPESGVVTESAHPKGSVDEEAMARAEEERLMKTVTRRGH